ncbi:MAG: hypothetical protein MK105_19800, partial [Crocinitomicaceae bacterium]|nr:hypothetical protein [Crocinitomicaceae bacterium]
KEMSNELVDCIQIPQITNGQVPPEVVFGDDDAHFIEKEAFEIELFPDYVGGTLSVDIFGGTAPFNVTWIDPLGIKLTGLTINA